MEQERLDKLISKMLDTPDRLSDSEIKEIAHDDYLRDIYDTAALLKSATEATGQYDLDAEWQNLQNRLKRKEPQQKSQKKKTKRLAAAIFLGILLCSAAALFYSILSATPTISDPIAEIPNDTTVLSSDARPISIAAQESENEKLLEERTCKIDKALAATNISKSQATDKSKSSTNLAKADKPSISQILQWTDDDCRVAQMFLDANYEIALPAPKSYLTGVNYSENQWECAATQSWLSEIMKYATGLTLDNLSIQRGSANMLYRLTYYHDESLKSSASDRETALSIIKSLADDGICENDTLTMILIDKCQDNLR